MDASGDVYVAGWRRHDGVFKNWYVVHYAVTSGATAWAAEYNGPASDNDIASAIAHRSGVTYVTGMGLGVGSMGDMTTLRINAFGQF